MHFLDYLLGVRLTPPALLSRLVYYHRLLATGLLVKCDFCPSLNITISAQSLLLRAACLPTAWLTWPNPMDSFWISLSAPTESSSAGPQQAFHH